MSSMLSSEEIMLQGPADGCGNGGDDDDNFQFKMDSGWVPSKPYFIGRSNGECMAFSQEELSCGVLVTGSMGTGKTTGVIRPLIKQILSHPREPGALILDLKDDYGTLCRNYAEESSCPERVRVLEPGGKDKINLLFPWMPSQRIADICISAIDCESSDDHYWTTAATSLLALEIDLARALLGDDSEPTFADVRSLHNEFSVVDRLSPRKTLWAILGILQEKLSDVDEASIHGRHLYSKLKILKEDATRFAAINDRTRTSITSIAGQVFEIFREPAVAETFCARDGETTADIGDIGTNGQVVVASMPRHRFGNGGQMIGLLIKRALFTYLVETRRKPWRDAKLVFVIQDEAQNFLACDSSPEADHVFASLARSLRCSLVLGTQDLASLYATVAPGRSGIVDNLLRNLNTQFHLGQPYSRHLSRLLDERGISSAELISRSVANARAFKGLLLRRPVGLMDSVPLASVMTLQPEFQQDEPSKTETLRAISHSAYGAEFYRQSANSGGKGYVLMGPATCLDPVEEDAREHEVPFIRTEAAELFRNGVLQTDILLDGIASNCMRGIDTDNDRILLLMDNMADVFEDNTRAVLELKRLMTPSRKVVSTGINGLIIKSRLFLVVGSWGQDSYCDRPECGFLVGGATEYGVLPLWLRGMFDPLEDLPVPKSGAPSQGRSER